MAAGVVIRADWHLEGTQYYWKHEPGYGYHWTKKESEARQFETLGEAASFATALWGNTQNVRFELVDADSKEILHGFGNEVQSAAASEGGDSGIIALE